MAVLECARKPATSIETFDFLLMQSFYGDRKWRALSECSGGVFELPRISSKNSKQRLAAFQYGVLDNISDGVSVWHLSSDKFRIIQNINRFPAFMKVLQNRSQNSFAFKSVWMAHTSSSGQYSRAKVPTSVFLKKNLQERESEQKAMREQKAMFTWPEAEKGWHCQLGKCAAHEFSKQISINLVHTEWH